MIFLSQSWFHPIDYHDIFIPAQDTSYKTSHHEEISSIMGYQNYASSLERLIYEESET